MEKQFIGLYIKIIDGHFSGLFGRIASLNGNHIKKFNVILVNKNGEISMNEMNKIRTSLQIEEFDLLDYDTNKKCSIMDLTNCKINNDLKDLVEKDESARLTLIYNLLL
jgi:hypothetical protein